MTRIIAGAAGGIRLQVPARGTRPTSDRVRESVFAVLDSDGSILSARVLDLYAGSGALGLEALSRGATSADLVERDAGAVAVARANAARVSAAGAPAARVHRAGAESFLAADAGRYDLVFADPPYRMPEAELTRTLTALRGRLADGAAVVVERDAHGPEPDWAGAGLAVLRHRSYGDTAVWWAAPSSER